jgi:hypothetical protein
MLKLHHPNERRELMTLYALQVGTDSWYDFIARKVSVGRMPDSCLTGSWGEAAQARERMGYPLNRIASIVQVII